MRSSMIIAGIVAVVAAAPAGYTVTQVTDVYTTVYEDQVAPTPASGGFKGWWKKGKPAAAATTVVTYVIPTPAAAPVDTPAAAPADTYSAPASEAAPVSTGGSSAPNSYAQTVVDHHNAHRANHSAPALVWDDSLASIAQQIGSSCVYAHDTKTGGGGYGQNIAAGAPASNIASIISDLFYNNEVGNFAGLYGQATPSNLNNEQAFDTYGHFTQIVWKGTTSVGCATVDCSGKGLANTGGNVPPYFTVCNYKSPGNFLGEFDKNVLPPLGKPMVSGTTTY
ncbi:PR-1-like protein [Trichodelitschia bisporula]|uniref:PR-1-like protein n=1 Tax=Trichodelitschia bisporula TaxID=703511 RepID=A0A6G1HMP5_9PEZI|nr:PR-1-like protein [Trichodelitschia bisporula]